MIYKICTHGNLNLGPHRDTSPHESVYSGLSPH